MKVKYKRIDTWTLEGLKKAERLKAAGWVAYSAGFGVIDFYKKKEAQ